MKGFLSFPTVIWDNREWQFIETHFYRCEFGDLTRFRSHIQNHVDVVCPCGETNYEIDSLNAMRLKDGINFEVIPPDLNCFQCFIIVGVTEVGTHNSDEEWSSINVSTNYEIQKFVNNQVKGQRGT